MGSRSSKTKSWHKINSTRPTQLCKVNYCTSAAKAILEDDAMLTLIKNERKVRADEALRETCHTDKMTEADVSCCSSISKYNGSIKSNSSSYIIGSEYII